MDHRSAQLHGVDLERVPRVRLARPPLASRVAGWLEAPQALAGVWLVAVMAAWALAPSGPVEVPLWLDAVAYASSYAWLALMIAGVAGYRRTGAAGVGLGGLLLFGHLACGFGGHVPMVSAVFLAQLGLIGGATAASLRATGTSR